jgi:hypothetical protein
LQMSQFTSPLSRRPAFGRFASKPHGPCAADVKPQKIVVNSYKLPANYS